MHDVQVPQEEESNNIRGRAFLVRREEEGVGVPKTKDQSSKGKIAHSPAAQLYSRTTMDLWLCLNGLCSMCFLQVLWRTSEHRRKRIEEIESALVMLKLIHPEIDFHSKSPK